MLNTCSMIEMSNSQGSTSRHEASPKLPLHLDTQSSRHEPPKLSLHSDPSRSRKPNRPLQDVSRQEAKMSRKPNRPLQGDLTSSTSIASTSGGASFSSGASTSGGGAPLDLPAIQDFDDLDRAIQYCDWEGDPELRQYLWDSYSRLIEDGLIPEGQIGTIEFWETVYNEHYSDSQDEAEMRGDDLGQTTPDEDDDDAIMMEAARRVEQAMEDAAMTEAAIQVEQAQAAANPQPPRLVDYSDSEDSDDEETQTGGGQARDATDFFDISPGWQVYVKKFKVHGRAFHVTLRNRDQIRDVQGLLLEILRQTLNAAFADADPTDQVGVEFRHPGLRRKNRYDVPFQPRHLLTPERLFLILEYLLGYDGVDLDEDFEIVITRIPQTRGAGLPWDLDRDWEAFRVKHKTSFIEINSNDDLCLPRALVVAKARLDKETDPEVARQWNTIREGDRARHTLQKRKALDLMREAGLQGHQGPQGEDELRRYQEVLEPEYQIKVISRQCLNTITFAGKTPSDKVLYLYHRKRDSDDPGHFCVLTKPHKLYGDKSYWCNQCDQAFDNTWRHKCRTKCNCCFKLKLCDFTAWNHCKDCNRRFRSAECFQNHITVSQPRGENKKGQVNKSICQKFKKCPKCDRIINYEKGKKRRADGTLIPDHKCGHYFCRNCEMWHPDGSHECYMQPIKDKKKPKKQLGEPEDIFDLLGGGGDSAEEQEEDLEEAEKGIKIFFDFESNQSKVIGQNKLGPITEHIPDYCLAFKSCNICRDEKRRGIMDKCAICGDGQWEFQGDSCKDEFCSWLFSEDNQGAIALAHNNKGYDGLFLVQHLVNNAKAPTIISKGREYMKIEWGKVRVIDSLNFFPMGLSALPKAFNIPELRKGFFPHKFDRKEHEGYVGRIPDPWFYDPWNMRPDKRKEFYAWYATQRNQEFDLDKELKAYCRSDVMILMRSCLQFERDMECLLGVRPFNVGITIASTCMYIFRKIFLKKDTIALIPHGGYRGRENQSRVALKWLKWISESQDINIQHAGNGFEKRVGKFKVDGFAPASNTVYEFNGCVWHGHTCRKDRTKKVPNSSRTMEEAYQATLERKAFLESQGHTVVEMWECQLKREMDQDPHMRNFFQEVEFVDPLDVKETLRGGRTNATRLYYKCKPGEKMSYVDFVSLYPYGVKWTEYPVGHPEVITENFQRISAQRNPYFGLIKCKILPPKKLLHPVLPYKSGGKLMFPLCRSCAEQQRQGFCTHSDGKRALTGEWVSTEVDKALEKGYRILDVYEVWHYAKRDKYNGMNKDTGLFTGYINFFLKLKIEASGWPKWVKTQEDKDKFIQMCQQREGIDLDPSKIEKNPGMRMIAKLCLNSFWGKFGQRSNMAKDQFVTEPSAFTDILFDQTNIVENVRVINDDVLHVTYKKEEEYVECLPYMNKVVAAFTTANCRLHLYKELEKLGDRVCYFDTDSIVYVTRPGDTYHPKLGSFLGEMTNELEDYGQGAYIKEFVSGGPKNYGFRGQGAKKFTVVKIRGFTLNFHASSKLNFNTLKKKVFAFVKGEEVDKTVIVQPQIARTADRKVVTQDVGKEYGIVYDKRWVLEDFSTLPYGTCEEE